MLKQLSDEQHTELDKLVESIKQGERVIAQPPGLAYFVAVNLLLIFSFITLFAPIVNILSSDWNIEQRVTAQFIVILLSIVCIVPPAILITRGYKNLQRWFILLATAFAIIATLLVITGTLFNIQAIQHKAPPLYVCIIISSLAALLARSGGYSMLVNFYYLLYRK